MNDTPSKWKDKEYKKKYNKQYRERKKLEFVAKSAGQFPVSDEKPQTERKKRAARKIANQVRPLLLDKCPQCGSEFLRRVSGKLEPMKLSSCEPCDLRFYCAGGKIE